MAVRRATQLLRLGVGSAALVSIPAMTYTFKVHAAEEQMAEGRRIKITELSMYENPEDRVEYQVIPEEISPLRQVIADARESVWDYLGTVQETTTKVKEKFEIGVAHTQEAQEEAVGLIDYLQNDPGMLPRAAVITVAGLGGIVAGYRGGVMRKVFFSSTAVAAAASLCYPNEAVALTSEAYSVAKESVMALWPADDSSDEGPKVKQGSTPTTADNQSFTVKGRPSAQGDLGQSKEEDKDMYTTRAS